MWYNKCKGNSKDQAKTLHLEGSHVSLEAERVYELAEEDLSSISFDAMKTLRYIQKERNGDMFYYHPVEYITADKEACLEAAKDYDYIALKVSGEKMLEAFNDGK